MRIKFQWLEIESRYAVVSSKGILGHVRCTVSGLRWEAKNRRGETVGKSFRTRKDAGAALVEWYKKNVANAPMGQPSPPTVAESVSGIGLPKEAIITKGDYAWDIEMPKGPAGPNRAVNSDSLPVKYAATRQEIAAWVFRKYASIQVCRFPDLFDQKNGEVIRRRSSNDSSIQVHAHSVAEQVAADVEKEERTKALLRLAEDPDALVAIFRYMRSGPVMSSDSDRGRAAIADALGGPAWAERYSEDYAKRNHLPVR